MKIEHLAIWCRNIDTIREFYTTYFNTQVNNRYHNPKTGFESYFLSFPGQDTRIEIMQKPGIPESRDDSRNQFTGYIHLAISVGSRQQVDELTRRLAEDGHPVLDGPRKTGDGYYESVVLDPEANRIEITE